MLKIASLMRLVIIMSAELVIPNTTGQIALQTKTHKFMTVDFV